MNSPVMMAREAVIILPWVEFKQFLQWQARMTSFSYKKFIYALNFDTNFEEIEDICGDGGWVVWSNYSN